VHIEESRYELIEISLWLIAFAFEKVEVRRGEGRECNPLAFEAGIQYLDELDASTARFGSPTAGISVTGLILNALRYSRP
jgi:hypothetical protein